MPLVPQKNKPEAALNRNTPARVITAIVVLVLSVFYALPNLYAPDAAVQVSPRRAGQLLPNGLEKQVTGVLADAGIAPLALEYQSNGNMLVRLAAPDDQLSAQAILQTRLSEDLVIALNLASTTPGWLRAFGAEPMSLGLDLSGGVHFLLEVDLDSALSNRLTQNIGLVKRRLREREIRYRRVNKADDEILISLRRQRDLETAISLLRRQFPGMIPVDDTQTGSSNFVIRMVPSPEYRKEVLEQALSQNLTTLRNRVNELGVSEPIVQSQGANRIIVQLPGIQDTAQAKSVIGKTANLEFRLAALGDTPRLDRENFGFRNNDQQRADLMRDVIVTGERVSNASTGYDENGQPQVNISLDATGGVSMNRATRNNVGRGMGVLFIEERTVMREDANGELNPVNIKQRHLINLATVRSALGSQFRIMGLDSPAEASELALLLRAGALAAPMRYVEERVIGPSLGKENIELGMQSVIVGFSLVMLFMSVYYKFFGVVSVLALILNLLLIISAMSLLQATLTLPGIAGIVLTVGMAVDANVLIFSRIREELVAGAPPQAAIDRGYGRAFVAIFDANLTTLLVAIVLYAVGTGPVRGFAITLAIGISGSMFTAVVVSRLIVNLVYGRRTQLKRLPI